MKVLFDHTIRQDAIRGEHGFIYESYRSGHNNLLKAFHNSRPDRNDWKQEEIDCLPKIAKLCRQLKITPYTTEELEGERFRALKFPPPNYDDLFKGIEFRMAKCPMVRSKWGISMEQYIAKEDVKNYCKLFFLTSSPERTQKFITGMRNNSRKSLSDFEEKCLKRAHIFKKICFGINETHYPDALHLWTAEENRLDVFLSNDKKFRNVIDRQRVDLNCKMLFPSELVSCFFEK